MAVVRHFEFSKTNTDFNQVLLLFFIYHIILRSISIFPYYLNDKYNAELLLCIINIRPWARYPYHAHPPSHTQYILQVWYFLKDQE